MTTFGDLTHEVLQTLNGYGLSQPRATFLSSAITDTATSIPVTDASNFDQGVAEIGDEVVFVESVDTANSLLTLSPDGRGYYGTTAAAHGKDTRIECAPTWPRHRIRGAINDVIVALYPTLWGVGSESFTWSPAKNTYVLPAGSEQILAVTATTIGPTGERQRINRYAHSAIQDEITIQEPVAPGQTVTVTYISRPVALVNAGDAFTLSGLRDSAKHAVVVGACAQLLAFMDAARLPVDTARADEYDSTSNAVGVATRIAAQMSARFEMEVEKERKRLRATTPVALNVRTR